MKVAFSGLNVEWINKKMSGLLKAVTKVIRGCLRMTKDTILVILSRTYE